MSFSTLLSLHYDAQNLSSEPQNKKLDQSYRFPEITLFTDKLQEQFAFYVNRLGFPLINRTDTQFALKIGGSILIFKQAKEGTSPFYHYAINIPSNKHVKAKEWLEKKTPLLRDADSDEDLLYFDFWDAHAVYFRDPAGNIGELIARHTMDNDAEGEFDASDLLCISEIGTPVHNQVEFGTELEKAFGLKTFGSTMFIGDENGVFVIPTVDRQWYPDNIQQAKVHPLEMYISAEGIDEFQYRDYPYVIKKKK